MKKQNNEITQKKLENILNKFWVVKLWALREKGIRLGLLGKHRTVVKVDRERCCLALEVISDTDAPIFSKIAAVMILDSQSPEWRDQCSLQTQGKAAMRDDGEVWHWRKAVLNRDDNRCRSCSAEEKLEAHHILSWKDHPEARLLLENGITLCRQCHDKVHSGLVPIWSI
jgi:hypothetical protein